MSSTGSTWYFAADGERVGPRSLDEMRALLADGTVTPETLVWTSGMSAWTQAGELPLLLEAPATEPEPFTPAVEATPRVVALAAPSAAYAWRRFFARSLDMGLPFVLVFALAGVNETDLMQGNVSPLLNVVGVGLWVPIEALLIALSGTTPGKALLGIRIANAEGGRPSPAVALSRSMRVWVQGLGLGLPLIILVTEALSYSRLTRTGATPWDDSLALHVEYQRLGPIRIIATVCFVLLMMMTLGTMLSAA
jgi:uncharacterized RDD family membrane protein YckC